MSRIVITEFMEESAVTRLTGRFDTLYDPELVNKPDDLIAALEKAEALIVRNRTQVRGTILASAERLRAVGRLGVGLDNIDVPACERRDIAVIPASGANDDSVAEYVITGALMLRRTAYHATERVAAGDWPRNQLMGREVMGARLGLVGFGSVARSTARRAAALGMSILACDPHVEEDDPVWTEFNAGRRSFDDLLAEADVISLHVPLNDNTRGLMDKVALARMKPDAVLINAARGGVVDEHALSDALRSGRIAGAMLDVFEQEPLPGGTELEDVPNLVLTPHIAGVTQESNVRVSNMIADRISAELEKRS